jgi:hypothetical protein
VADESSIASKLASISREAVLAAIAEYDKLGREAFLTKYGFGPAREYLLLHKGKEYDSKAIVGAAYGYQHPDERALAPNEFTGGVHSTVKVLERLQFDVPGSRGLARTEGKLFFFTAASATARVNFQKSLEDGVPLELLEPLGDLYATLKENAVDGKVFAWGARPGSAAETKWARLERGDWGLVYSEGQFPLAFEVFATTRSHDVALAIWGEPEGVAWECIFFMRGKTQVNASRENVVAELGYAPNYVPQGFEIPGQKVQERIYQRHGSPRALVHALAQGRDAAPSSENSTGYWWVNQGKTFRHEIEGSLLWAPLASEKDQRPRQHWLNLQEAKTGDQVFHYANGAIRAVGEVKAPAQNAPKPQALGKQGWATAGLLLPVQYELLESPLGLNEIPASSRIREGGPFNRTGGVQQGYFYGISKDFASEVNALLSEQPADAPEEGIKAVVNSFAPAVADAGLSFDPEEALIPAFVASLTAKPFGILSGLSGSGKTQLAMKLGDWLGPDRMLLEAVRPDWTGPEFLFGYEDALLPVDPATKSRGWHVPRTLEFALDAAVRPKELFLLVLDEMNLAHVERYFSDFLSGLESRKPVLPNLKRSEGGIWRRNDDAPDAIPIPPNLWVVGTVNVDETTYLFSPKVLDRANTFEFRVTTASLRSDATAPADLEPGPRALQDQLRLLSQDDEWHIRHPHPAQDELVDELRRLHGLLSISGHEFGHRVFYEALRFAALFASAGDGSLNMALDRVVLQKVLPRMHGSRRRLEPPLQRLAGFTVFTAADAPEDQLVDPLALEAVVQPRLPLSFVKLRRMAERLRADQFASFAE